MRKRFLIGLAIVVAAVLAIIFWLLPRTPHAGPWRLADGSELSLAGVTYGKHHTMRYGNRLADYLYPILPNALRKKFGCKVTTLDTTNANAVVIWFWDEGVPASSTTGYWGIQAPCYCLNVADASGMESDTVESPQTKIATRGTNVLHGWELKQFPRRSRAMKIRIYGAAPNRQREGYLAEFSTRNPVRRGFSGWEGEQLPIAKTTNGLEATLAQFETGQKEYWGIPNGSTTTTNYVSTAGFIFRENQRPAGESWRIVGASATAASGEVHDVWGYGPSDGYDGLDWTAIFKGTFWPEEPAWRLKLKVGRTTNYPPEELWTVTGVPIPAKGKNISLSYKNNIYGAEIELFAFRGEGGRFVYDLSSYAGGPPALFVRSPLPAEDTRLEIVGIKDNLGRQIEFSRESGQPGTGGRGATIRELVENFPVTVPAGAEKLDITFAYTKCRNFEFVAKPTIAKPVEPK